MAGQFLSAVVAGLFVSASVVGGSNAAVQQPNVSAGAIPVELLANGAAQSGGSCEVRIQRTGEAGSFDVSREVSNNSCVCNVQTGPEATNGAAEDKVAAILRERECPNAPVVATTAEGGSAALLGGGAALLGGAGALAAGGNGNGPRNTSAG